VLTFNFINNACWDDIHSYLDDAGNKRMRRTIHETKSGERQHVFLNDMAMEVIDALPKILHNPHIIAGQAISKPIQTYAKAWRRVLQAAEVPYFKPHGLRHNYVSTLVAAGEPMDIVGHLVGHKNSETTKKYAHHRPDWLQKSTERFGQVISMAEKRKV
jgi:integrase